MSDGQSIRVLELVDLLSCDLNSVFLGQVFRELVWIITTALFDQSINYFSIAHNFFHIYVYILLTLKVNVYIIYTYFGNKQGKNKMKISLITNGELIIQANSEKDYLKAQEVANKMEELDEGRLGVCQASADDYGHWIHLCADWDNYRAEELKALYKEAKAAI